MNYYNFFSEHTKAYKFKKLVVGFLKYALIFSLSFALSFFLIYNSQFNENEKISGLKKEVEELKKENKKLSETVDSMNIQIDNVKKFYDEEKKAKANQEQTSEGASLSGTSNH